eukprot:SAG11_NODE_11713_length_742_cov_1.939347_1_plen_73_part_00
MLLAPVRKKRATTSFTIDNLLSTPPSSPPPSELSALPRLWMGGAGTIMAIGKQEHAAAVGWRAYVELPQPVN